MHHRKSIFISALLIVLILGGAHTILAKYAPLVAQEHVLSSLHNAGFANANTQPDIKKPGILIFKNINLDTEGFSTIKTIKLRYNLRGLTKNTPITDIKIDGLNLTGDGAIGDTIEIAGLNTKNVNLIPALNQISDITISNSNIDVFIPSLGGINLHYDLRLTQNDTSKDYNITGRFSGKQKQLNIDGTINGHIASNDDWEINLSIEQGKFNHTNIKATRLSGLIKLSSSQNGPLHSEIQLTAGGLTLFDLPWQSANANISKQGKQYIVIAEGKSIGQRGIEFGTELTYTGGELQSATGIVHTQKLSDILNYLSVNNVKTIEPSPFTSLDKLSALNIKINADQDNIVKYTIQADATDFQTKGDILMNSSRNTLPSITNAIIQTLINSAP